MEKLLAFVADLEKSNSSYTMSVARADAVLVTVVIPGERVEVEFFAGGRVEIERFVSDRTVSDAAGDDLRSLTEDS